MLQMLIPVDECIDVPFLNLHKSGEQDYIVVSQSKNCLSLKDHRSKTSISLRIQVHLPMKVCASSRSSPSRRCYPSVKHNRST